MNKLIKSKEQQDSKELYIDQKKFIYRKLFSWTFYSNNPVFHIDNIMKWFLSTKSAISEWFLKDHVTLKTGVMAAEKLAL